MKLIASALLTSALVAAARAAEIRVVGSDLLGDGFARAAAAFARQDGTAVKLDLRGTRPGMEDLAASRADVALLLLPVSEAPPVGAVVSRVMGYQVAVVVVPAASPLTQITTGQLRGWFGEAPGDRPAKLLAVSPSAGLAWPLFRRVILQDAAPYAGVELFANDAALAQHLAKTANAVGVAGAGAAGAAGLRVLAIAAGPTAPAYAPMPENVHRGSYPLRLVLHAAFQRTAAPDLQRFLKFLLAEETAAALAPAGFLPLPAGVRNQLVFELEEMH